MKRFPPRKPRNPNGWPDRDRGAQAKFRRGVVARNEQRCAYIDAHGQRCTVTGAAALIAHHRTPGNNDPATGVLLCQPHHAIVDSNARVRHDRP